MPRQKKDKEFTLTEKQEAFVEAFLGEALFNPILAYEAAGYAGSMKPYAEAMKVLSSKAVINAIHKRMADMKTNFWMTEDVVIQRLWKEATDDSRGSSHAARINALVWIGKHLGMWQDKAEEEKDTRPIIKIQNFGGVSTEVIENKIKNTPEVEEAKDNVELPEGVAVIDYSRPH